MNTTEWLVATAGTSETYDSVASKLDGLFPIQLGFLLRKIDRSPHWVLTGSSLLAIILNANWGTTDLDIFTDEPNKAVVEAMCDEIREKYPRWSLTKYTQYHQEQNPYKMRTIRGIWCFSDETSKKVLDIVWVEDLKIALNEFDFQICAVNYGGGRLSIPDPQYTFQRMSRLLKTPTDKRLQKYLRRGIKIVYDRNF